MPGLGDIPVVGNLFKSRSRSYIKTNLMVFLRPVIVRDAAATEAYSLDRYDLLRTRQLAAQPQPSSVLSINHAPVLPQLAPTQEPPPGAVRRAAPSPLAADGMPHMPVSGEGNYYGTPISSGN